MLTDHAIHGDVEDLLWISDQMRRCATCEQPKVLDMFFYNRHTNRVTKCCRKCIDERKKARQVDRDVESTELLGTALSKHAGRQALIDSVPKAKELLKGVYKAIGGQPRAARLAGRAVKVGMQHDDSRIALKAANTLFSLQTQVDKNTEAEIDLSTLTEQDKMMILFPVARKLLLDDPGFRKFLFTDVDVRTMLLEDQDIRNELLRELAREEQPVVIEVKHE